MDSVAWIHSRSETYTVKGGYKVILTLNPKVSWAKIVWHKAFVLRFSTCIWRLLHGKIITYDTLKEKGWRLASKCCFCANNEETRNHIFVSCKTTTWLWTAIFLKFGKRRNRATYVQELVEAFSSEFKGMGLCSTIANLALCSGIYNLWKAINKMVFHDNRVSSL